MTNVHIATRGRFTQLAAIAEQAWEWCSADPDFAAADKEIDSNIAAMPGIGSLDHRDLDAIRAMVRLMDKQCQLYTEGEDV